LATRSGRLLSLDPVTGSSSGYVQLPQSLNAAPAIDVHRSLLFQIAEHSNLYVLGLDDGICKQVYLLDHDAGAVTKPPVVFDNFLLVSLNDGIDDSVLHVLAINVNDKEKGAVTVKPVQQIRFKGHIDGPPLVDEHRVLVTTDRGLVRLFELSDSDPKKPLHKIAETVSEGGGNGPRFTLLQDDQIWIADTQLSKYDIHAADSRLVPKWIINEHGFFTQKPSTIGPAIIEVYCKTDVPGVLVAAVAQDAPEYFWETRLAIPLASAPIISPDGNKISAVTSVGGLFQFDTANFAGQANQDLPTVALDLAKLQHPIDGIVALNEGVLALSAGEGSTQIAVFDPREQRKLYRWLDTSDKLKDKLDCTPVAFNGGLLIPGQSAQIFWLQALSGQLAALPFQSPLKDKEDLHWLRPTPCGEKDFVLADNHKHLYRVGIDDQKQPRLTALNQAELSETVTLPPAVVDKTVFVVDAANRLTAFSLPNLALIKQHKLTDRCIFGPLPIGHRALLGTADNNLFCFDNQGNLLCQTPMPYGPLAGAPLTLGDHLIFAYQNGTVCRIDASTGNQISKIETARTLGTAPVQVADKLLIGGTDGCLYLLKIP
jgi:hypothetical protein